MRMTGFGNKHFCSVTATYLSDKELILWKRRENYLDILIHTYGFESEPTLFFVKYGYKDLYNMEKYFLIASNWVFR